MAGPIAARIVGPGGSLLLPAALVGALLVLVADLSASTPSTTATPSASSPARSARPFLLFLLVRTNRAGGSL